MANPIPRARDAALISMLNKRGPIRPGLKLPAAWVTVIDGVSHGELVWPDTPPRAQTRPETPSQKLEPEPDTDQPTPEPSRTPQRPILTPEEFAVGAQQALAGEREAHRTLTKPLPRTGRLARVKTLIIELLKLPPRYSAEYGPAIAFINAMQKDNEGFAAADTLESYLKTANVVAAVTPDPTVIFGKG